MGPVSAALVATVVAVTVTALWLAANEYRVRRVISAARRAVVWWARGHIGERLPPCVPERRFGVGEAALLTLVGGLIALCGLAVAFAELLDSVMDVPVDAAPKGDFCRNA